MLTGAFEVRSIILITLLAIPYFVVVLVSGSFRRLWKTRMGPGKSVNTRLLLSSFMVRGVTIIQFIFVLASLSSDFTGSHSHNIRIWRCLRHRVFKINEDRNGI